MILAAERDLFPDDLFEGLPQDDGRAWWLAHTKPRQEKAVARDMLTAGQPFYLPCLPRRTRSGRQVLTAHIPLFAGYVFVRVSRADRALVFAGRRVARLVSVADQERLWADLRQIRKVLDLGQPVTAEERLEPGTPVAMRDGPLAGLTGTIVRAATGHKFVVRVDLIQRGVSVVVDGATLGKLSE
jgi:transcriptional antiterminator RfaH